MKNISITLLALLLAMAGFGQNIDFEVRSTFKRAIKKQQLSKALLVSDVIEGYPFNWISNYVQVEISGTDNKAVGNNNSLNAAQKNLLASADLASEIDIKVKYKYKNPVTDKFENSTMHVMLTVVPDVEAEFAGGYEQLKNYLENNCIKKIQATPGNPFMQVQLAKQEVKNALVYFTIDEAGNVTDARIQKSSGNVGTDHLLLEAINNMPKWKPATNANGIKVRQGFKFNVRTGGC